MSDNATIGRAPRNREHPYVQIARQTLQDSGISFEASGLLCELLSRPDNWKVQVNQLRHRGDGKDRIYRILSELITACYIRRIDGRNERGHLITHYLVYETPQDAADAEPVGIIPTGTPLPYPDKPYPENTDVTDKRGLVIKEVKEKLVAPKTRATASASKATSLTPDQQQQLHAKGEAIRAGVDAIPTGSVTFDSFMGDSAGGEASITDGLFNAVEKLFAIADPLKRVNYTKAGKIVGMLWGTKDPIEKKKPTEWEANTLSPQGQMTGLDLEHWASWWLENDHYGMNLPSKPDTLMPSVQYWIAQGKPLSKADAADARRESRPAYSAPVEPELTDKEREEMKMELQKFLSGQR